MLESEPEQGEIEEKFERPLCQQCRQVEFKYKCPECSIKTCSLQCVKAHKKGTGCTGKKKVHGFVKMNDFSLTHLWRDYSFINQRMNQSHAFRRKYLTEFENSYRPHLKKLRSICRMRGTYRLNLAPAFSKQHAMNNSYFDHKNSTIYWSVLLVVKKQELQSQAEHQRWLFIAKPQCEKRTILDIMREYILKKTKFYSVGMNEFLSEITLNHILKGSLSVKAKKVETKAKTIEEIKLIKEKEEEKQGESKVIRRNLAMRDFGVLKLHQIGMERSIEEAIQGTVVNEFPIFVLEIQRGQ